ncbi:retrovirus-related Pol polyprotein from transposon 297 [Elysia marginata]|uniref:Retrovirus-related Pol polyprotein from transposon 297 n=1 Tax=Elysia marginata TaxID=1093978 RepID=A0AAV4I5U1_9GAST|nr:retrovirus-related Pol polyprotein from transposon 297 [Elysia marginata]
MAVFLKRANMDVEVFASQSLIWSMLKDFCRAGRRAGGTVKSPPRPAPRQESSPTHQPSPSQPPPKAPAQEESDSGPLQFLKAAKFEGPRIMRWALALQAYNFHVQYIKRSENVGADYLSRIE